MKTRQRTRGVSPDGHRRRAALALAGLLVLAACGETTQALSSQLGLPSVLSVGGSRPAQLELPRPDRREPLPLLLLLHGYGGTAAGMLAGYRDLARRQQLLLLAPEGTLDSRGKRFWNASDACCDFEGRGVDDAGYLRQLLAEVRERVSVDESRIFVVGYSNGGFMAQRLACEASELAAVISIAGAYPLRPDCAPARSPSLLQVHGQADHVVKYQGGRNLIGRGGPEYPGALEGAGRWARHAGCASGLSGTGTELDLDATLPGPETAVQAASGCPASTDVRLWTMRRAAHTPTFNRAFRQLSWEWLSARRRQPDS